MQPKSIGRTKLGPPYEGVTPPGFKYITRSLDLNIVQSLQPWFMEVLSELSVSNLDRE